MKHSFPIDKLMLDVAFTLVCLFAGLFAIEVMQEKAQKANVSNAITSPEKHIMVEMEWPKEMDVDIDLWVKAPADEHPVGYSRTNDKQTSYERDDKGVSGDLSDYNYEVDSIRALVPGIYVVNVHWFGNFGDVKSVPVKVRASLSNHGRGTFPIVHKELTLTVKGQEVTAFSFEIDADGAMVEGSISDNYIPMRLTQ